VYLSNLLLPSSLVYRVAIVSEKGDVKGHLSVSVRYLSGRCCRGRDHLCVDLLCLLLTDDEVDDAAVEKAAKLKFDTPMTTNVSVFKNNCFFFFCWQL